MRTLIPYAAAAGPQCQQALATLQLPQLKQLLQLLTLTSRRAGNPQHLTPLHERIVAQFMGLEGDDGLIPWAALDAQRLGLTALHGGDGWAWITPCHWTLQSDHASMADPLQLALTGKDAEALWQAMQPYFQEDGITLFVHALGHSSTRWLAHGAVFKDLPTASLDRVGGHTVDAWMPRQEQAKTLRRLQNEMQMLLYTHPVNDARAKFKLDSVNSFWVSGTGSLPANALSPPHDPPACTVRDALRGPALQDHALLWCEAWEALDSTTLSQLVEQASAGQPVWLTLCGELQAITLENRPLGLAQRLRRRWTPLQPSALLGTL